MNRQSENQSQLNNEAIARRKRINLYKSILVWTFLLSTMIPIVVSIVLLGQVSRLEKQVANLTNGADSDQWVLQSSGETMMLNPDIDLSDIAAENESNQNLDVDGTGFDTIEPTKKVYLTFDDGPTIYTGQILDILEANDVKATFFVIAKDDERLLPYYKQIVDEGHALGMHSYTHDYKQMYASLDSFENDVTSLSDFLYEQTGVRPTIYRFPGGSSNSVSTVPISECIAYLNEQHISYYDWNALNGDAVSQELSVDQLIDNIMGNVRKNNTSIVLMHDMQSKHTTVESLQPLIDILKEEGYEIVPIDENAPLIQHVPYDTDFDKEAD